MNGIGDYEGDAWGGDDRRATASTNRTAKSGGKSKGNDGFLTPPSFLDELRKFAPIGLDPSGAPLGSFVQARKEYRLDRGENGLLLPWVAPYSAGSIFDNPPYSQTRKWIEKADAEHKAHPFENIFLLVAARTDTIAFQGCKATAVCFWKGRITFLDPVTKEPPKDKKGKPCGAMFPSMVLYYGARLERFRNVFGPLGRISLL